MCRAGLYYPPARLLLDEQLPLWHRSTTGVSNAISAGKAQVMKPQSWVKTELGPREHMISTIELWWHIEDATFRACGLKSGPGTIVRPPKPKPEPFPPKPKPGEPRPFPGT